AGIFCAHFGVTKNGNALSDPHHELAGKNILYVAQPAGETDRNILEESKRILFELREKRPRPHRDDKILTDWNGLMISSLAYGARILGEARYLAAARKATDFILSKMKTKDGRLLHRYRDGEAVIPGFLEDYAFFIHGLVDLYEATFDAKYLEAATFFTKEMTRLFWDASGGGFFLTGHDGERLISESKELYDGAIPSGNSVAALSLLRVGRLTQNQEFETQAHTAMGTFSAQLVQLPSGYSQMLAALDFAIGPTREIVIEGNLNAPETRKLLEVVNSKFLPNSVILHRPAEGKTKVSVCNNYVCGLPVFEAEALRAILE
ncbi:MAG: thioredoxin domain-containing protein, partial [Candidatus Omnitrophica bacterium]|nr:thioredoxin domain-containing protein [Candidatus Omnitrophota bacterium]